MGRRGYPAEFRRKGLDLVEPSRPVADVAKELRISRSWRPPSSGSPPWRPSWPCTGGPRSSWERWCLQKAVPGHQGDGRRRREGLSVQLAARVLDVSASGYYE